MKSRLALLIGAFFIECSVMAERIDVCDGCAMNNLPEAVSAAKDGDHIVLKSGVYAVRELLIDKAITISGEPGAVLDGGGYTILYVKSDSVKINDIELRNVATNYVEDRAAIKCNDSDFLQISGVRIRQSFFGILIEKSKYGVIENCDVQGEADIENYLESANGNAIHLWYCNNMTVRNNYVSKHRDGIYFEFVEHTEIEDNHSIENMRYGLHFMFSHNNVYENNKFERNGAGVAVMYSDKVRMYNNAFFDNWGESAYGLLIKDIRDSELRNNIFKNNTIGISADNSSRVKIANNRFTKNGYALRIMGNCTDNVITGNDFLGNSFDVTTNARTNFNDFNRNYWEEYTGYDLNSDEVGDIPYRPVKLFTYIIAQSPASIILMRSGFIDLLNLAEKVTPVLTPESLVDNQPMMKPINDHLKSSF